jgi:hypothetical protein
VREIQEIHNHTLQKMNESMMSEQNRSVELERSVRDIVQGYEEEQREQEVD